ncbi:hypothetical protein NQ317_004106 [Molorchus minor]|uniref:Uncharacterized protein n=1 Tax=Molorchus minor TaxID=1323400 RepID=A0ABQ9JDH6_9CUCU|nr:hypothetical protein NQ317_004106 [Molorchus minor]
MKHSGVPHGSVLGALLFSVGNGGWDCKVAPQIRAVMIRHGSVMMAYQPLKKLPNFFRFVSQNSSLTRKDVDFILDHMSEIGGALFK